MVFFKFHNATGKILTQIQNSSATKLSEFYLVGYFFSDFIISINFFGFFQCNLQVRIFKILVSNDCSVSPNLKVTLIDVNDHIEVFICAVCFLKDILKYIFQNAHHSSAVDAFKFLKFSKGVDKIKSLHLVPVLEF